MRACPAFTPPRPQDYLHACSSPVCLYRQAQVMPGMPCCPAVTRCAASRYEMCLRLGEIMNDLEEHDWYNKLDGQDRTPSWVRAHFVLETELARSRASRPSLPPWQLAQVLPPIAHPPPSDSSDLLQACLVSGDRTLDSIFRVVRFQRLKSWHGLLEDWTAAGCQSRPAAASMITWRLCVPFCKFGDQLSA